MQVTVSAPSPDDNPIDWTSIQAMYFQGVTPSEISAKTGVKTNTISVMASRKGWAVALRKAKEAGKATKIEIGGNPPADSALVKHSERVRKALGRDLERVCELLEDKPPSSLSKALERQSALESVVRNAKTVFGWSEGQSTPAVRISILGDAQIQTEPGQESSRNPEALPLSEPKQLGNGAQEEGS